MSKFQRGDKATVILFNTMTLQGAASWPEPLEITINPDSEVKRAGAKQITLRGRFGDTNVPVDMIGLPVSDFRNVRFLLVVPKGGKAEDYIPVVKDFVKTEMNALKTKLAGALKAVVTELDREDDWFKPTSVLADD